MKMDRRKFLITAAAVAAAPHILADAAAKTVISPTGEKLAGEGVKSPASGANPSVVGGRLPRKGLQMRFFPYELQLRHAFNLAKFSRTTTPDVQVEISFDGVTGYGEASMPPYLGQSIESVCNFLSRVDLSAFRDPFCIEDILEYVDSLSPGDTAAKAAIDIALHDLVGNMMGQPLYRIFGLNPEKAPATSFTIGIDSPEVVREKTLEALGKYRILKVKVGLDSDREMIETIRSVTDLPLVVDANQGWKDREKALDMLFWLHEQGVQMAEQPMPKERLDDIAWLSERSPIPIFADESIQRLSDVKRISGAFNGINIKLMKCTGLNEARKMIAYARAEGMKVMMGCMTETSCAVSAAAQLSPAVDFADLDGNLLISNDPFEGVLVENGMLRLSGRPGLGLRRIR